MIKRIGRFTAAFLTLFLSAAITVSSFSAAGISTDEDDYAVVCDKAITEVPATLQNVAGVVIKVNFGQPNVFISVTIGGYSSTSYRNGVITLTKLDGANAETVKEWTGLSSSGLVFRFIDESVTAAPGKYRLSISVATVRDGISEVVSGYIDITYDGSSKKFGFDFKLGDLNQNGARQAADLTILMKIISGKKAPIGFQNYLSDTNCDGAIDAKDLTKLMKMIASGD